MRREEGFMSKTVLPSGATVTTFPAPAAGFDLFSADAVAREAAGRPAPPFHHPELLARWHRLIGKPLKFIEPTFERSPNKQHRPRHASSGGANTGSSSNWS